MAKDTGINVARYVQEHYTPYYGDSTFLAGPSANTKALWSQLEKLCAEELQKGIMDVDPKVPSTITAFGPGYIDREKEVVVGLQTDAPLKRAVKPLGGINMVKAALQVRPYHPATQAALTGLAPSLLGIEQCSISNKVTAAAACVVVNVSS